ncbi:MAG: hypothetical protein RIC29_13220 [Rhodospirillaceae bacterium]
MTTSSLDSLIAEESKITPFPAAAAMVEHLKQTYGSGVQAVVFYGSCLRLGTDKDLMLDFYVLVEALRPALNSAVSATFGTILPPNVYYHECDFEGRVVRAKVAVMTLGAFVRGTSETTFAPALWARFAQPAGLVYAATAGARTAVEKALARAVRTLLSKTVPLMGGPFEVEDLWITAFRATYKSELRPEPPSKANELVDLQKARFIKIGQAALRDLNIDAAAERQASPHMHWGWPWGWPWDWRLRRWWGRFLNAARLIKAAFTFKGGLDYAVWKIERHSGVKIELTDRERATPVRTGLRLLLQTKQQGGLN